MYDNILYDKHNITMAPVSDLVELEVENRGQLKAGHYVDNRWICIIACSMKLQMEIKKREAIIIAI